MRSRSLLVLSLLLISVAPVPAEDRKAAAAPQADVTGVEVRYADGSVVKVTLLQETVEVATRFGPLKVPSREIHRIELGLRLPDAMARQVSEAVAKLGGEDEKARSAARAALLALGDKAYPWVDQASRSADPALARRARELLAELAEKVPEENRRKVQDTVITGEFPIVGRIGGTVLKARSPFFGDVEVKLSEVRSVRWIGGERETRVALDASKHGLPQQVWMDTGIEVQSGVKLEVKASGAVDLYPGQGGRFTASPDGLAVGGAPMIAVKGGAVANHYSPGALLGKIGENGKVFVVGSKYEGTPREDGKLFLMVAPSPWGTAPSGAYDVRVSTGGK